MAHDTQWAERLATTLKPQMTLWVQCLQLIRCLLPAWSCWLSSHHHRCAYLKQLLPLYFVWKPNTRLLESHQNIHSTESRLRNTLRNEIHRFCTLYFNFSKTFFFFFLVDYFLYPGCVPDSRYCQTAVLRDEVRCYHTSHGPCPRSLPPSWEIGYTQERRD